MRFKYIFGLFISSFLLFTACDNHDDIIEDEDEPIDGEYLTGTGDYTFSDYVPLSDKPVGVYYHVPSNTDASSPILIVLPGAGRDAEVMRNNLIDKANQKGVIIASLYFADEYYPGGDAYNLANIFVDGDNPTPQTLNPQDIWTISVIDPIFDDFKERTGNSNSVYDLLGHSAGAQIAHRFLTFLPNSKFDRIVASAAGWYTMPDNTVDFPYGLAISPMENGDLTDLFGHDMYVIVGQNDTDPNSAGLRHTPEADAQGNNRYTRAQYYYSGGLNIAADQGKTFGWTYKTIPNADHDSGPMANAGMDILYP